MAGNDDAAAGPLGQPQRQMQIAVGSVENLTTRLSVSVNLKSDGRREIWLYTAGIQRLRDPSAMLILDAAQIGALKQLVAGAEAVLARAEEAAASAAAAGPPARRIVCPHCSRPAPEGGGAAVFCAFCGCRLRSGR